MATAQTNERLNMILNRIFRFAQATFGAKLDEVVLYGSYARGDYDAESDVDIMVLVDMPNERLSKYRRVCSYFAADLGVESDILISITLQSKSYFDEWRSGVGYFHDVDKEGVRINA
jgi:predicted nucleotidyltransferase